LLRLAVLLHRSHSREDIPWNSLKASNGSLELELPEYWLAAHPLTQADLATEVDYLRDKQRRLEIVVT
jgi:exopolyphosphatase/guanosine-5'-triphosphate,3'-diphosphate pyrophosphatase